MPTMRTPGLAAAFSRATIVPRWVTADGTPLTAQTASWLKLGWPPQASGSLAPMSIVTRSTWPRCC